MTLDMYDSKQLTGIYKTLMEINEELKLMNLIKILEMGLTSDDLKSLDVVERELNKFKYGE